MLSHGQVWKNKKSCDQREQKWIEARIAEYQDNGEASKTSEGQLFVLDKITGEKRLGWTLAQAKKLWLSLEDSMD